MTLSIIIPVLNDAAPLAKLLENLASQCAIYGVESEIIVVDGGSCDGSAEVARSLADKVVISLPGRARQMNAGAAIAKGDRFWFLHADASVSPSVFSAVAGSAKKWGRCDVALQPAGPLLRLVGLMMNLRSRATGICTGDQGIFCARDTFERVNGYPDIPLMEDIVLSEALCKISRPQCLRDRIGVSSRRWRKQGTIRTILLMWWLRLCFFFGADPVALHQHYYGKRT